VTDTTVTADAGTGTGTKPLAVVTGASSGIGLALAKQFAQNDYDVVIAAEDSELADATTQVRALGAEVVAVQVDLSKREGVERLYEHIKATGRPVDAIALNAGIGAGGQFVGGEKTTPLYAELQMIELNVSSTVHLAKLVMGDMVERGEGRVLFTSSIASTTPGPYQAVYHASKSFVQSFAESVREEVKDSGVTVTSLMPGPVDTEFFERADLLDTAMGQGPKDDPDDVAAKGFKALMSGDAKVTAAGLKTKAQALTTALTPDKLKAKVFGSQTKPGSAPEPE
jgi:short-subunit dehydrogenase